MIEAGHPVPDAAGLEAADRALTLADGAGAHDLVLVLMSGGASANWIAPVGGISFEDKQALTRGLEEVANVEPWTTSFNPGTTTLERLLELTREVDFAAFVFAQDDWTSNAPSAEAAATAGQASPRDNVVFEAGLFGGVLGMRRTFILHASGAPSLDRSVRPSQARAGGDICLGIPAS